MAPLRQELKSGDIVKVLSSPSHKPSKDWLHFVKTSKAKTRIRHFIKAHQREADLARGRDLLEKSIRRHSLKIGDLEKSSLLAEAVKELHYGSLEDLLAALGGKEIEAKAVIDKLRPVAAPAGDAAPAPLAALRQQPQSTSSVSQGVVVKGLGGMLVSFAQCCSPVHGDSILGYVTVGRGVSVHRSDCVNAPDLLRKAERLVEVAWADGQAQPRPVEIEVTAFDRDKLMTDMLLAIAKTMSLKGHPTALTAASATAVEDGMAQARFTVGVADVEHLKRVMLNLHQVQGVSSVKRREKRLKGRTKPKIEGL
jgi:GTP pyrophosphokinase